MRACSQRGHRDKGKVMTTCVRAGLLCVLVALCCVRSAAADDALPAGPFMLSMNLLDGPERSANGRSVAADTSVRFRVFGIYSESSGNYDFPNDVPLVPNDLDFEDTLGMDMDKFTGGALLGFNFGTDKRWHLDLSFNGYYDYTGDRNVGSIEFNGEVFVGRVKSSLEVYEGIAAVSYDLWRNDSPALTLNTGLDLHLYWVEAQLSEVLGTQSDEYSLLVPMPAPSLKLRWDLTPNVFVRGGAAGMYLGELGNFYELSAEVGYDLSRNVGVFVGYRYWSLHFEYNDKTLDFDNSGVYAGVEVRM